MSFEQKTWQNKDSNGNLPTGAPRFDADNMNRIEKGIADSLQKSGGVMEGILALHSNPVSEMDAVTKKYVDENNLLFSGSLSLPAANASVNVSYLLPSNLDLSKYIGIFFAANTKDAGGSTEATTILLVPDNNRFFTYQDSNRTIYVKINSSANTLQFSGSTSTVASYSTAFNLVLIPVLNNGTISKT